MSVAAVNRHVIDRGLLPLTAVATAALRLSLRALSDVEWEFAICGSSCSTARDNPSHGKDADRKIGDPRYQLWCRPAWEPADFLLCVGGSGKSQNYVLRWRAPDLNEKPQSPISRDSALPTAHP